MLLKIFLNYLDVYPYLEIASLKLTELDFSSLYKHVKDKNKYPFRKNTAIPLVIKTKKNQNMNDIKNKNKFINSPLVNLYENTREFQTPILGYSTAINGEKQSIIDKINIGI
ncbi:MAG: hypothetical protein ACRC5R_02785 [Mycoplasmatales bacterium]